MGFDQSLDIRRQWTGDKNHTTAIQIKFIIKFFYHIDIECCIIFHGTIICHKDESAPNK